MAGNRVVFTPDGTLIGFAGVDGAVHIYDLATAAELAAFKGHTAPLTALAIAPDGKTVTSASVDTTALVWDMTTIKRPQAKGKTWAPGELDSTWQALASDNAAKAFTALCDLSASPTDAVAWIKKHLPPVAALDMKRVQALLDQLDDDQFEVRERATEELAKLGDVVLPTVDKALAAAPPLEVRKRLQEVRQKFTLPVLSGERLRSYRAVEVLERIGTAEAREVLRALADGASGALVTEQARGVLQRLEQGH
jgi:hypothetical protein